MDADGGGSGGFVGTHFFYDGTDVLFTRNDAGAVTHRYTHGPLVDQVLADELVDGTPGSVSDVRWALADHLGTTRRLMKAGGTAVADFEYDSFGKIPAGTTKPSDAAVDYLFGFTGQQFDGETGLTYMKARYYDPNTGRMLAEDPSGFDGGQDPNLYRYVGNSPTNATDPTGMVPKSLSGWSGFTQRDPGFTLTATPDLSAPWTDVIPNTSGYRSQAHSVSPAASDVYFALTNPWAASHGFVSQQEFDQVWNSVDLGPKVVSDQKLPGLWDHLDEKRAQEIELSWFV